MGGHTLTMFASPSPGGTELAAAVQRLAAERGISSTIIANPDAISFSRAVFTSTIVVIDGTLEPENLELYRAASVVLSPFHHVLLVGRTYLPLNFVAQRKGGAAPYPYPMTTTPSGTPLPDLTPVAWRNDPLVNWDEDPVDEWIAREFRYGAAGTWTNDDVARWLQTQIDATVTNPGPRVDPSTFQTTFLEAGDASVLKDVFEDATGRLDQRRDRAFISHRGFQFRDALRLAERLRRGEFHGTSKDVVVIKPGALALPRELLTEARRWMIMGLLDDEMRRSDELWIVESADPKRPYRGSWWTAAELYAAAYVAETPAEHLRIRVWDPKKETARDDDGRYRIELTEEHRRRMARLLSHTRPDQAAPESRISMKLLRGAFRIGLGGWVTRRMKAFTGEYIETLASQLPDKMRLEEVDFAQVQEKEHLRAYVNDRVFSDEFWDDLYIEPQKLREDGSEYAPDATEFLTSPQKSMIRIRSRDAASAMARGRPVRARNHDMVVPIVSAPSRYLWRPVRAGVPGALHELPTYLAVDHATI